MAVTEKEFVGSPVTMTDGKAQVIFDTPSDFADWLAEHYGSLERWHWCQA
jgi:hypothetical protein